MTMAPGMDVAAAAAGLAASAGPPPGAPSPTSSSSAAQGKPFHSICSNFPPIDYQAYFVRFEGNSILPKRLKLDFFPDETRFSPHET